MQIKNVVLFSYDFPHKKTENFIYRLHDEGYNIRHIFAAPRKKLTTPKSLPILEPHFGKLSHPRKICEKLKIPYTSIEHENPELLEKVNKTPADLYIISGARILPKNLLQMCKGKILNIHPGLLPEVRGLDTILWSIYHNVPLGISSHFVTEKIDFGPIIHKEKIPLKKTDKLNDISKKLIGKQSDHLIRTLELIKKEKFLLKKPEITRYNSKMPSELEKTTLKKFNSWVRNHAGIENSPRVAIIGVGSMGKNHVRIYSQLENAQLCGISDINPARQKIAKSSKTKFFQDFKELIKKEEPDIVSICVPTSLHHKIAKYCLNKKIHVLLEKPIAANIKEAHDLLKTAKAKKVKLLVGHIERFNPAVRKVKEMIDKNILGQMIAIIVRRVGGFPPQIQDTDVALDLAIHDIDIVNYLLQELPKEIHCHKQKNYNKNRTDSADFFLKYKKTSAYIQANWVTPVKIRKMTITGTKGYLEMDYIKQKIEFYTNNYKKSDYKYKGFQDYVSKFSKPKISAIPIEKKEPLKEEILFFLKAVKENKNIDSKFALDALKIAS